MTLKSGSGWAKVIEVPLVNSSCVISYQPLIVRTEAVSCAVREI